MGGTVLSVDMTRENELPHSLLHVIMTIKNDDDDDDDDDGGDDDDDDDIGD